MEHKIIEFVDSLSTEKESSNVFNQYSLKLTYNAVRRNNLLLYLLQMKIINPKVLLVGEAPGYQGCRLTGVPFTSESILIKGIEQFGLFGHHNGYQKTNEVTGQKKEPAATIIWETLVNSNFIPLLWNAFPFHPYKNGKPQSNRTPNKQELEIGKFFLKYIIEIYNIDTVVAIGNHAESTLNKMIGNCKKVRHPSYGGKAEFVSGIQIILSECC